ncbi:MAG: biotin/lipoyl-binding protein [Clostridia bacterium]|nr:biotin/lipoyl-binding protein [Clostridia bacterium]
MKYRVDLNGKIYEVEVEEGNATLLKTVAVEQIDTGDKQKTVVVTPASEHAQENSGEVVKVKSPLPGQITAVKVEIGQIVKKGEVLVIIEAMKMESEIVAPSSGKIVGIHVKSSQAVQTADLLVEIE